MRCKIWVSATLLTCTLCASDDLVRFGDMPEDALIQTGVVVTVETDNIAIPMINAVSNKLENVSLHALSIKDDRVASLHIAEPLITNLVKGAFTYDELPSWPSSGVLLPGDYGSTGNLWADVRDRNSERYLWQDRELDEYLWGFFYAGGDAPFLPVFDANEWVLAIVNRQDGYVFRMLYLGTGGLPVDTNHGTTFDWVAPDDPEYSPAATEEWVRKQVSDIEEHDPVAMAAIAQIPGADGIFTDVETEQIYHIVVSNGHWLIRYAE